MPTVTVPTQANHRTYQQQSHPSHPQAVQNQMYYQPQQMRYGPHQIPQGYEMYGIQPPNPSNPQSHVQPMYMMVSAILANSLFLSLTLSKERRIQSTWTRSTICSFLWNNVSSTTTAPSLITPTHLFGISTSPSFQPQSTGLYAVSHQPGVFTQFSPTYQSCHVYT